MDIKDYQYAEGFNITEKMKRSYAEDGYVIVRGLFPKYEVKHIENALHTGAFAEHTYALPDGAGKEAHMILWNHPGVDVTGMVARCEKIVNSCETFLGGEVYHYHTKLMKKPAKIGGQHVWHQDYGYWYDNGCLFPNMMTVFIAIDRCAKKTSCLQVLKGSHKCGRIEHKSVDGQVGADMDRVDDIAKTCPPQYVEMDAGIEPNNSVNRKLSSFLPFFSAGPEIKLISQNVMFDSIEKSMGFPVFLRLSSSMVKDSAILECQDFTTMDGKWLFDFNTMKCDQIHGRMVEGAER